MKSEIFTAASKNELTSAKLAEADGSPIFLVSVELSAAPRPADWFKYFLPSRARFEQQAFVPTAICHRPVFPFAARTRSQITRSPAEDTWLKV